MDSDSFPPLCGGALGVKEHVSSSKWQNNSRKVAWPEQNVPRAQVGARKWMWEPEPYIARTQSIETLSICSRSSDEEEQDHHGGNDEAAETSSLFEDSLVFEAEREVDTILSSRAGSPTYHLDYLNHYDDDSEDIMVPPCTPVNYGANFQPATTPDADVFSLESPCPSRNSNVSLFFPNPSKSNVGSFVPHLDLGGLLSPQASERNLCFSPYGSVETPVGFSLVDRTGPRPVRPDCVSPLQLSVTPKAENMALICSQTFRVEQPKVHIVVPTAGYDTDTDDSTTASSATSHHSRIIETERVCEDLESSNRNNNNHSGPTRSKFSLQSLDKLKVYFRQKLRSKFDKKVEDTYNQVKLSLEVASLTKSLTTEATSTSSVIEAESTSSVIEGKSTSSSNVSREYDGEISIDLEKRRSSKRYQKLMQEKSVKFANESPCTEQEVNTVVDVEDSDASPVKEMKKEDKGFKRVLHWQFNNQYNHVYVAKKSKDTIFKQEQELWKELPFSGESDYEIYKMFSKEAPKPGFQWKRLFFWEKQRKMLHFCFTKHYQKYIKCRNA